MKADDLKFIASYLFYTSIPKTIPPGCMWGSKTPEVLLFLVFEMDLGTQNQIYFWDVKIADNTL